MSRIHPAVIICVLCACAPKPGLGAELDASITIDQALEIAFANSPSIRVAADQVRTAEGALAEAVAGFRPSLSAGATQLFQGPKTSVEIPGMGSVDMVPSSQTSFAASASAPIDVFGRLPRVERVAGGAVTIERLSLADTSEQLILDVKLAFYNLLRAQGQEEVAQAAVEAATARLRSTESRHRAGTVAKFDVMRAEVEVANLNQRLIEASAAVETARSTLNQQMGIDTGTPTTVTAPEIQIQPPQAPEPGQVERALSSRPAVEMARIGVKVGEDNVKLERMGLTPYLSASGVYNYDVKTTGFGGSNESWRATLDLHIPIWDGGITKAKVEQADAQASAARDMLRQAELGVALEVRTAALDLEQAAKRAATTRKDVEVAEEALRLANVRYEAGIAILVEVIDAESSLTQARVNLVNATYDYAAALARLQRAMSTQPEMLRSSEWLGSSVQFGTQPVAEAESSNTDRTPAPQEPGTED